MSEREILEYLRLIDRKIDELQVEVEELAVIVLSDRAYPRTSEIQVS